jgi:hypothetical protein
MSSDADDARANVQEVIRALRMGQLEGLALRAFMAGVRNTGGARTLLSRAFGDAAISTDDDAAPARMPWLKTMAGVAQGSLGPTDRRGVRAFTPGPGRRFITLPQFEPCGDEWMCADVVAIPADDPDAWGQVGDAAMLGWRVAWREQEPSYRLYARPMDWARHGGATAWLNAAGQEWPPLCLLASRALEPFEESADLLLRTQLICDDDAQARAVTAAQRRLRQLREPPPRKPLVIAVRQAREIADGGKNKATP